MPWSARDGSISLYPLIIQKQAIIHEEAQPWLDRLHHRGFFSTGVTSQNARFAARQPRKYLALWQQTLWENRTSSNFLIRAAALFPKAVWMAQQMHAEGICHIHAHYASHPALVAWLVHRLSGIPYSLTAHAHDIFVRTAMLATKLREAAFIVAISEYNRDFLARLVGDWVKEKTSVIHCGIEPHRYTTHSVLPAHPEPLAICHTGSLQPYKGQAVLLEACSLLAGRNIPFHCKIIGEGKLRSQLQAMIEQKHLDQAVELVGARTQSEVARLLAEANCYVQPSIVMPSGKMEGIPVSLMEAMACRLPVVATAISGIPELVIDGFTGWLVPPGDAGALANALTSVHKDPKEAARRAENGRQWAADHFDLEKNVSNLCQLFKHSVDKVNPGLQMTVS